MTTSTALREIFTAGRPLVEQWLDVGEQMAALRDAATAKGLDWSQVKALLKAQIQDERDEAGDGKRVRRIVEKAEFASAYADMLGLAKMNENNFSPDDLPPHDRDTGELLEDSNPRSLLSAADCPAGPTPLTALSGIHSNSLGMASEGIDPSIAPVSPPVHTYEGADDANAGESHEVNPASANTVIAGAPVEAAPAPIPEPFEPPAFLVKAAGPMLNKDCQKPASCRWSHSQASCSDCANAAIAKRQGRAA